MILIKGDGFVERFIIYTAVDNDIEFLCSQFIEKIGRIGFRDRKCNVRIAAAEGFDHGRQEAGKHWTAQLSMGR